jgi:hypothetical protein
MATGHRASRQAKVAGSRSSRKWGRIARPRSSSVEGAAGGAAWPTQGPQGEGPLASDGGAEAGAEEEGIAVFLVAPQELDNSSSLEKP